MSPVPYVIAALLTGSGSVASPVAEHVPRSIALDTGRVNGHDVLGCRVSAVLRALGEPDFRNGDRRRHAVGYGDRAGSFVRVSFRRRAGALRATSIVVQDPAVRDVRIGRFLVRGPRAIQSRIAAAYAEVYRLARPYACRARFCTGEFRARESSLRLTFGLADGATRFVNVWRP